MVGKIDDEKNVQDTPNVQDMPGVRNGGKKGEEEEDKDKDKMNFWERLAFLRLLPGSLDARMPWVKEVTVLGIAALAATGVLLPLMMLGAMTLPVLVPLWAIARRKKIKQNYKDAVSEAKEQAKLQERGAPVQDTSKQKQLPSSIRESYNANSRRAAGPARSAPPMDNLLLRGKQYGGYGHF